MENYSLATNLSLCYLDEGLERKSPFFFFFLGVIIIAIPTNAFSLYISLLHIGQKKELGVYVINLAMSDLLFTVGLSFWTDFLWNGVWVHGTFAYILAVYVLFTNFYTSEAFLCCIALDRYFAVVHPFRYPSLRKVSTAVLVSVSVWILVGLSNVSALTWEDRYAEHARLPMCFDIFPQSRKMVWMNVFRFILGFAVPMLMVVYSSLGICAAVRSNQATEEQERRRVARLLGTVLLCLAVSSGFIHSMMLIRAVLDDWVGPVWLLYPYRISQAVASLNCLLDPLLYCFITRAGKANVTTAVKFFQRRRRYKSQAR